ncbi:MAG TPA: FIST C-terminal domain-containing protein [Candidatus Coprosoma intestinipullorum]|uniref:FIST C-terminal domain-containing protein n=1 Tax=Candidatus Coprosoma intestinipullorum TaxID=2840752 RepID=A0A9D1CY38_9FIRM|nr:FIST C-terminal domain-containing protein [Candidatus Coprosoma intestinipullorum]
MLKTKVGYSENPDAYASGVETATMANVIENPSVGLFFTSCNQDQNKLMEGAKSILGNVPIIGCTSSAAICTQDGYLNKETGYSGMMLFGGDVEVVTAGSKQTDETPREVGRRVAKEAISKRKGADKEPDFFFMTASPANEEEYLEGIQDVIGNIPVFGGSAADNTVEGKWSILNDGEAYSDGLSLAVFYTDGEMKNLYTGAYHETNNVGVITKVRDERTLVEIDHKPALKVYAEWTGKDVESLKGNNLLTETICAPLGVKDPIGKVTAVRHPMFGNDDYSMNIGANLAENTAVIQLSNSPEGILKANEETIKNLNNLMTTTPNSYFLVHCGGRRLGLALSKIEDQIYPEVKKVIPDKEFLMVFTFGEYGTGDHSSNTVGGLSLSYTGFGGNE